MRGVGAAPLLGVWGNAPTNLLYTPQRKNQVGYSSAQAAKRSCATNSRVRRRGIPLPAPPLSAFASLGAQAAKRSCATNSRVRRRGIASPASLLSAFTPIGAQAAKRPCATNSRVRRRGIPSPASLLSALSRPLARPLRAEQRSAFSAALQSLCQLPCCRHCRARWRDCSALTAQHPFTTEPSAFAPKQHREKFP